MNTPDEVKALMVSKQSLFHRLELWKEKEEGKVDDKGPTLAEAAMENVSCSN